MTINAANINVFEAHNLYKEGRLPEVYLQSGNPGYGLAKVTSISKSDKQYLVTLVTGETWGAKAHDKLKNIEFPRVGGVSRLGSPIPDSQKYLHW